MNLKITHIDYSSLGSAQFKSRLFQEKLFTRVAKSLKIAKESANNFELLLVRAMQEVPFEHCRNFQNKLCRNNASLKTCWGVMQDIEDEKVFDILKHTTVGDILKKIATHNQRSCLNLTKLIVTHEDAKAECEKLLEPTWLALATIWIESCFKKNFKFKKFRLRSEALQEQIFSLLCGHEIGKTDWVLLLSKLRKTEVLSSKFGVAAQ